MPLVAKAMPEVPGVASGATCSKRSGWMLHCARCGLPGPPGGAQPGTGSSFCGVSCAVDGAAGPVWDLKLKYLPDGGSGSHSVTDAQPLLVHYKA